MIRTQAIYPPLIATQCNKCKISVLIFGSDFIFAKGTRGAGRGSISVNCIISKGVNPKQASQVGSHD